MQEAYSLCWGWFHAGYSFRCVSWRGCLERSTSSSFTTVNLTDKMLLSRKQAMRLARLLGFFNLSKNLGYVIIWGVSVLFRNSLYYYILGKCYIVEYTGGKKENLLASTSIFLTKNYFSKSGPKPSNFQFYSLDSI